MRQPQLELWPDPKPDPLERPTKCAPDRRVPAARCPGE